VLKFDTLVKKPLARAIPARFNQSACTAGVSQRALPPSRYVTRPASARMSTAAAMSGGRGTTSPAHLVLESEARESGSTSTTAWVPASSCAMTRFQSRYPS
jgi:hypothetical protein